MIINNLLPVPLYEFDYDLTLTDQVLDQAKNQEFTNNTNNKISDKKNFYNQELFAWFRSCLNEVRGLYYIDTLSLEIISCWVNRSSKYEYHHPHFHPNSIVSGIFYLTDHEKGETVFYHENPWKSIGLHPIIMASKNHGSEIWDDPMSLKSLVKPKKGKLILFPSSIRHKTEINLDTFYRYTISFNTHFSGKVNDYYAKNGEKSKNISSDIHLNPSSVEEQIKSIKD